MLLGFIHMGIKEELGHAEDRVERGAELMRDHGQEGPLEIRGGLNGPEGGLLLHLLSLGGHVGELGEEQLLPWLLQVALLGLEQREGGDVDLGDGKVEPPLGLVAVEGAGDLVLGGVRLVCERGGHQGGEEDPEGIVLVKHHLVQGLS